MRSQNENERSLKYRLIWKKSRWIMKLRLNCSNKLEKDRLNTLMNLQSKNDRFKLWRSHLTQSKILKEPFTTWSKKYLNFENKRLILKNSLNRWSQHPSLIKKQESQLQWEQRNLKLKLKHSESSMLITSKEFQSLKFQLQSQELILRNLKKSILKLKQSSKNWKKNFSPQVKMILMTSQINFINLTLQLSDKQWKISTLMVQNLNGQKEKLLMVSLSQMMWKLSKKRLIDFEQSIETSQLNLKRQDKFFNYNMILRLIIWGFIRKKEKDWQFRWKLWIQNSTRW